MKRTKIVCTVGPGTDKFGILEDMMRAGMNVARFNFSHGISRRASGTHANGARCGDDCQ